MAKDIFLLLPLKLLQVFACDSRASLISFSSHLLAEGNSKFLVHLAEKLWRFWFAQQNLSQALSPAHANFLWALPLRYKQNHYFHGFSRACEDSSWNMALAEPLASMLVTELSSHCCSVCSLDSKLYCK